MSIRKFILCVSLMLVSHSLFAAIISGNSHGDITVVEFFDYQCPHCRNMAATINSLIKQNPNVRVVYRMLPVLNNTSWFESRAALASLNQNKFQDFHDRLFNQTKALNSSEIILMAKQIGLNPVRLQHDMSSPSIKQELYTNLITAKNMNINAIPTFLIGRTDDTNPTFRFSGETSYAVLENAILQLNQSR